eukprot:11156796-Lingulodinium_polyedra.AAC.1
MPQTNARAERCNQDDSGGLRASLVTVGLSDCGSSFRGPLLRPPRQPCRLGVWYYPLVSASRKELRQ